MLLDELEDAAYRVFLEVAVYNLILLFAFEDCGEGEDSEWKATVTRLGGSGVIEDDHAGTSAMKMRNSEGVRRPLSFARSGRRAQ
jgi:hypothetical protein